MSMHLMKIRVTEKSNSKKWKSAEAKRQAQELEESWKQLKEKHETPLSKKPLTLAQKRLLDSGSAHLMSGFIPPRGPNRVIPSKDTSTAVAAKPEPKVYTGDKVIGISIVHKSCLQPVFTEEQAKDLANMRR